MRYGLVLARVGAIPPKMILEEIKSIKGVIDSYAVFGRFDIVIFINAENYYKLKDIAAAITNINGIKNTETLVHGD
jgi:hypothetical protein